MAEITDDIKSSLKFLGYSISSLDFKRNDTFEPHTVEIKFDITRQVHFSGTDSARVALDLVVFPDAETNGYPFTMRMTLVGDFKVDNYDPSKDASLFEINAVSILFPYIRALVTTITANANVPPLILPPVNVIQLIRNSE